MVESGSRVNCESKSVPGEARKAFKHRPYILHAASRLTVFPSELFAMLDRPPHVWLPALVVVSRDPPPLVESDGSPRRGVPPPPQRSSGRQMSVLPKSLLLLSATSLARAAPGVLVRPAGPLCRGPDLLNQLGVGIAEKPIRFFGRPPEPKAAVHKKKKKDRLHSPRVFFSQLK